jgi:hypothetical protein
MRDQDQRRLNGTDELRHRLGEQRIALGQAPVEVIMALALDPRQLVGDAAELVA